MIGDHAVLISLTILTTNKTFITRLTAKVIDERTIPAIAIPLLEPLRD